MTLVASYSETFRDNALWINSQNYYEVGQSFTGNGESLDTCKFYLAKSIT